MFSTINPYQWVAIRLPNDSIKVEHITPNRSINLGKYGTFNTNQIINRPFHLTWEILDRSESKDGRGLRLVKAAEIHADTLLEEAEADLTDQNTPNPEFDEYGLPNMGKSNVNIFDDPANQKLTMDEIEALKADEMANPKDLIAKLMASHSTIDKKTAFSLAKYTVRKRKKYMKQFTVLPLDIATITDWMMNERDFSKVMEVRNETLGLIGSWANVHAAAEPASITNGNSGESQSSEPQCRYLVVDDTGGLVLATIAERMGLLHHNVVLPPALEDEEEDQSVDTSRTHNDTDDAKPAATTDTATRSKPVHRPTRHHVTSNTITMIHSNQQPNLSLLRYFNFDPNLAPNSHDSTPAHPLHTHLRTLSWLQLLEPTSDSTYTEPPTKTAEQLHASKSNARATYHRKRRRWERCKAIVDEARAGDFNALVVATHTDPTSIVRHLVPLLAGGAQIVVYHPHVEPLTELVDAYSTARRAAFVNMTEDERQAAVGGKEFPVDPTLTLGFMLQTARVRKWQVLPGRTHPLMTGKGGAEGYVAVATRVVPVKGEIRARGKQGRNRVKRRNGDDPVAEEMDIDEADNVNSSSDDESQETKRIKTAEDYEQEDVDISI